MAKKIIGYIKLQLPAGKATPQPPVGPALGAYGVAIPNFTKEFNERTKNDIGLIIPVVITVYADRSFTFSMYFISRFTVISRPTVDTMIVASPLSLSIAERIPL